MHSLLSGRYASRMRGRGLNFEEIRDYRPGDDVRSIDWKVTARLQQPHVRVFNEERDRQALLVVDQRLSMFFGSRSRDEVGDGGARLRRSARGASSPRATGSARIVFDDRDLAEVRPQRSRRTCCEFLGHIVDAEPGPRRRPRHRKRSPRCSIARSARRAGARCTTLPIVIISDFDGADERDTPHSRRHGGSTTT